MPDGKIPKVGLKVGQVDGGKIGWVSIGKVSGDASIRPHMHEP